jgi:hypothetical protein
LEFFEENPSGLEESQKPGAVANTARTGKLGKTLPGTTNPLSTVPEGGEDEKKEKTWWIPSQLWPKWPENKMEPMMMFHSQQVVTKRLHPL